MEPQWEDTRSILTQLADVYQNDSELAMMLKQRATEVTAIYTRSQTDIRNSIRELAKQVCGDDGAISRMEGGPVAAVAVHQDQMSKLNIEGATATQAVEALKAEENRQRSQVKAFEDAITSAESEKVELEAKREADIPRVKHCISLYTNVTSIRWDEQSSTGAVSGYILPPNGGAMKSFDFKPTEASKFEIANRLWDLIDAASPLDTA